jgi:hypothetical protein
VEGDSFSSPSLVDELALAARSSASFPGAFEASFIFVGDGESSQERPDMSAAAGDSMTQSGYVVDGGVLDNKPVEAALDAIREQRVGDRFRRVLLYVVPDPTETVRRPREGEPGITEVVWSSLVTIPRNETVVSELREMRENNRRAEEAWAARRILGATLSSADLLSLSRQLFSVYRSSRIDRSIRYVVEQMSQGIARSTDVGLPYRGRRSHLLQAFAAIGGDLPWIPEAPPNDDWTFPSNWTWGGRPVEEGLLVLSNTLAWADTLTGASPSSRTHADLWRRYFEARSAIPRDVDRWRDIGEALIETTDEPLEQWLRTHLHDWAEESLRVHEGLGIGAEADRRTALAASALTTAGIIGDTAARVREALARGASSIDPLEDAQMAGLLDLLAGKGQTAEGVLRNLLRFHVVASALGREPEQQTQVIELMQVSAAAPDPFGTGEEVDISKKLAGVQLGHFGAFYKQAWRANDWMRGRLDGATRIVQLLVNPRALKRSFHSSAEAIVVVRQLADAAEGGVNSDTWMHRRKLIEEELAFLDDPGTPLPESLPETCAAIARRLQIEIATEELVTVARACEADRAEGKGRGSFTERFLDDFETTTSRSSPGAAQISGEEANKLLPLCRIGEERIVPDDVGTDRFASAVATSLALAAGTIQAPGARLGPLRSVLAMARAPLVMLYLLVTNATGGRAFGVALTSIALTFGLTVAVLDIFVDGLGVIVPIAWVLLIGGLLSLVVRGILPLVVVGVLALVAIGVALWVGDLESLIEWVTPILLLVLFLFVVGIMWWPRRTLAQPGGPRGRRGLAIDMELAKRLEAATNAFYSEVGDPSDELTAEWRQTLELIRAMRRS